ncbi:MAG: hypothetical protein MJZ88_01580 [Paludibacteraceae bacterium]|nr:hypothetical protein [Paludibacteraceae bacterium]
MTHYRYTYLLVCLLCCATMGAQDRVYLEHSETLSFDQSRLPDAQILRGDVRFRHDDALMYCDSAYFYEQTNSLDAFGRVRFVQGDTLQGFGDVLYYDGNTKIARLRRHVKLVHRATTLTTDSMNYNRTQDLAYYFSGGTIQDSVNTLQSRWGQYHPSTNQAIFRDDVQLENDRFTMSTATLYYNTKTHVADLVAPTTILYQGETTIHSSNGWYNTSTQQSMLLDRSLIEHQDGKFLTADTIFYDKAIGFGRLFHHIEVRDTVQQATLTGNYGEVYEYEKRGFATDSALLIEWSQPNYTYMHADTLYSEEVPYQIYQLLPKDSILKDSVMVAQSPDTLWIDTTYRQVRAFHHVRAYNVEYQVVCDSLTYNARDSIAILHHLPICWNENNQISADSITVFMKEGGVDHAHGIGNAIMIKQEGISYFDQMAGKEMFAYVDSGQVSQVDVNGNAETVFYPKEDDGSLVGVNKTQSSFVSVFLENQKVHHVLFTTQTTGTMYPIDQIEDSETRLTSFFWAASERPLSPNDVFSRPIATPRPTKAVLSASEEEDEEEDETIDRPKVKRNRKRKN